LLGETPPSTGTKGLLDLTNDSSQDFVDVSKTESEMAEENSEPYSEPSKSRFIKSEEHVKKDK
jgi:hypothetical protein